MGSSILMKHLYLTRTAGVTTEYLQQVQYSSFGAYKTTLVQSHLKVGYPTAVIVLRLHGMWSLTANIHPTWAGDN